jgi:hypothetical protein
MAVEVLRIDSCPNWEVAVDRIREALDRTGHRDVEVGVRVIGTASEAQRSPFGGSPTIVVDGVDLFASADVVEDLACRVYRTPFGVAGCPTVDQIIERLVRA